MLVIRYFRTGKTNQPYFKVVVTDKKRPTRGGRFVEELGQVDPVNKKRNLKADRVKYWLSVGAQPSDTVYNLLVSEKIIEGKKRDVHNKKKLKKGEVAAPVAVAPAAVVAPAAKPVTEQAPATPEPTPQEPKAEEPTVESKPEPQAVAEEPKQEEAPPAETK